MRLAFMGTPEFSVPVLSELSAAGHDIAAVYTRAPQPSGRGKKLTPSPVQQFADRQAVSLEEPQQLDPFVGFRLPANPVGQSVELIAQRSLRQRLGFAQERGSNALSLAGLVLLDGALLNAGLFLGG